MQGGGQDRAWYGPLLEDGTREMDLGERTIGCHTGPYAGLNVVNPQEGFEYRWGLNDPRELLRARMAGSEVVQADYPEYSAYRALDDPTRTSIDTSELYQELVLLRTPTEKVRERRQREQEMAERSVRGSVDSYTDRAGALEADLARRDGKPTRFARSDHMVEFEEDGRAASVWTHESGVVRR
jgi:hypothetical protein